MLKGKDYPLIPRILHCIEDNGETVVVEEYVQGESLLDPSDARRIFRSVRRRAFFCS